MRNEESVQGSWLRKNEEVHPREATGRDRLPGDWGSKGSPAREMKESREGEGWTRRAGTGLTVMGSGPG